MATIIDTALLFVFGYVIALFTGNTTETGFELEGAPALLLFVLGCAYYIAMEATVGATLGKLLLGLRVARADGSAPGWGASIIRNVLRIVDGLFVYVVGAILVWTSPTRQRLGDHVAGTVVLRTGAQAMPASEATEA